MKTTTDDLKPLIITIQMLDVDIDDTQRILRYRLLDADHAAAFSKAIARRHQLLRLLLTKITKHTSNGTTAFPEENNLAAIRDEAMAHHRLGIPPTEAISLDAKPLTDAPQTANPAIQT